MHQYLRDMIHAIDQIANWTFFVCFFLLALNPDTYSRFSAHKAFYVTLFVSALGVVLIPSKEMLQILFP